MAGTSVNFDQPRGDWALWAQAFLAKLTPVLNRCQKVDEEFEPPHAPSAASRIVMTSANGTRYAVTVSNAGAWVVTAL